MGAFDYGVYKRGMNATGDARLQAALIALRIELAYNGFGKNLVIDSIGFGEAMENRTKEFQTSVGINADGQIGQKTATELFRKRVSFVEGVYGLSEGTLGKQLLLESAYDPVALGFSDPADHGIAQINLRIHNDVTVEQAYDPTFALDWAAKYIRSSYDQIATTADVMKAARAAYNVGDFYAAEWMKADFPSSGRLEDGIDWYARAYNYIQLVNKQNW